MRLSHLGLGAARAPSIGSKGRSASGRRSARFRLAPQAGGRPFADFLQFEEVSWCRWRCRPLLSWVAAAAADLTRRFRSRFSAAARQRCAAAASPARPAGRQQSGGAGRPSGERRRHARVQHRMQLGWAPRVSAIGSPEHTPAAICSLPPSHPTLLQGSLLEAARAALQAVREREPADSRHRQQGGDVQVGGALVHSLVEAPWHSLSSTMPCESMQPLSCMLRSPLWSASCPLTAGAHDRNNVQRRRQQGGQQPAGCRWRPYRLCLGVESG